MDENELARRWKQLEAKVDALPEDGEKAHLLRELAQEYSELSKLQKQAGSINDSDGFAMMRIFDHDYMRFMTKKVFKRVLAILICALTLSVAFNALFALNII